MLYLHEHQTNLNSLCRESLLRGNKSVLIQAPTGYGKTICAAAQILSAYKKNKSVIFSVPRRDLVRQISSSLYKFGIDHSFIAAGYSCNPLSKIFLATHGTLKNRFANFTPDVLFVDEVHHGGDSLGGIIDFYKAKGAYIIGLSATPIKISGQGLSCWFDDIVCGESVRWLIDNKYLSDYKAYAPSRPDLSGVGISAGDYAKGQLSSFMEQDRVLIGNAVSHYKKYAEGRLNIAYCVSIKHSQMVAESFRDAGIPAAHMDGETPPDERIRIIRAFANRELKVLTNCELLTYGFDLASQVGMDVTVECMSDLRPTKSLALQMQKWGRVLRKKDYPALIFDHANNLQEHGLPCQDRVWSLDDRKKRGSREGEITIPVKQCDNCFFCHKPAPTCPNCGHVYPVIGRQIDEVEGELSEVDVAQAKQAAKIEVGRAKTIAELKAIAAARGYKSAWVWKMAQAKGIRA